MGSSTAPSNLEQEVSALKALFEKRFAPFDWDRAAVWGLSSFFTQQPSITPDPALSELQKEVLELKNRIVPPTPVVSNDELQKLKDQLRGIESFKGELERLLTAKSAASGKGKSDGLTLLEYFQNLVAEAKALKNDVVGENGSMKAQEILKNEYEKLVSKKSADEAANTMDDLHSKADARLKFSEVVQAILIALAVLAGPLWGVAAKAFQLPLKEAVVFCSITLLGASVGLAVMAKSVRANRQRMVDLENKRTAML